MDVQPIQVHALDRKRFDALVLASRSPALEFFAEELEWYANEDEPILGVLLLDATDQDYAAILLVRDEVRRYRCFEFEHSLPSIAEARGWLTRTMKWHTGQGVKVYPQGDPDKRFDLFKPVVPPEKLHASFQALATSDAFLPARAMISELMPHFVDVDGIFVREFQTRAFDARLWELYLNAYLVEEVLFLDRQHHAPDFIVRKYGKTVAIEAVIVGRKADRSPIMLAEESGRPTPPEITELNRDAVPIRFGSSLYSKLQKRYWDLDHVGGFPLVFAIADFHEDQSMTWTQTGLMQYLYGFRHMHHHDEEGKLVITPHKIDAHRHGDKTIPSGFFFLPEAENVSAVLFSASGTISKFNRVGRQAGFQHPGMTMLRVGVFHDVSPDASVPRPFQYVVDETCEETWAEGLSMFHNPNARYAVPSDLFPSIAHHRLRDDGQVVSEIPAFHPYASFTYIIGSHEMNAANPPASSPTTPLGLLRPA